LAEKAALLEALGVKDVEAFRLLWGDRPVTAPLWAAAVIYCAKSG
jgi:hypothetical protein